MKKIGSSLEGGGLFLFDVREGVDCQGKLTHFYTEF